MSNKSHFSGHRIEDISFQRGWVSCGCGAEFKVKIEPEEPIEIGREALAAVFWAHRKAEALKAGEAL